MKKRRTTQARNEFTHKQPQHRVETQQIITCGYLKSQSHHQHRSHTNPITSVTKELFVNRTQRNIHIIEYICAGALASKLRCAVGVRRRGIAACTLTLSALPQKSAHLLMSGTVVDRV